MKVHRAVFLCKHEHHIAAGALVAYVTAWKFEKADKTTTAEAGES